MPKALQIEKGIDNHLHKVLDGDGNHTTMDISTNSVRVGNLEVTGNTIGVSLKGGTMTDNINMGDNDITDVDSLDADKFSIAGGTEMTGILDEDNMASDSAVKLATQQSIKAYADTMLPLAGGSMSGNINLNSGDLVTTSGTHMDITSDGDVHITAGRNVELTCDNSGSFIFNAESGNARLIDDSVADDVFTPAHDADITTKKYVDERVVLRSVTTLSESDVNGLGTTAIELVAAQGSGKVIIPTSGMLFIDRDSSTAQTAARDLVIGWNGANSYLTDTIYYIRRFMYNEGGDRIFHLQHYTGERGQSLTAGDNQNLTINTNGALSTGSIDSMKVVLTYHVYDNS